MKQAKFALIIGLLLVASLAQSQVYNYFPPPGITYTQAGGMSLGVATGGQQGSGTLNAQAIYVDGVPVTGGGGSGTVTAVSVTSANGMQGSVLNPNTTPAISVGPNFTGIAYANGASFSAAIASNFPTLNQNTTGNAATATTAGAFSFSPTTCSTGQAAGGILANGNATNCITPYSVVNESANYIFAGPASGTAALPTFRSMVAADLPLSSSITWTGPNTWTAPATFTPASGQAIGIQAASGAVGEAIYGSPSYSTLYIGGNGTTGESFGLSISAGTNSGDLAINVTNASGSINFLRLFGDGGLVIGVPTGGSQGVGTINMQNAYLNGYPVGYLGTPFNVQTTNYTLQLSDRGKTIALEGSSGTITIPAGVFSAGDVITILAYASTYSFTIAPASGVGLNWAVGNLISGSRTLTSVGIATILCVTPTAFVISGSGIS